MDCDSLRSVDCPDGDDGLLGFGMLGGVALGGEGIELGGEGDGLGELGRDCDGLGGDGVGGDGVGNWLRLGIDGVGGDGMGGVGMLMGGVMRAQAPNTTTTATAVAANTGMVPRCPMVAPTNP